MPFEYVGMVQLAHDLRQSAEDLNAFKECHVRPFGLSVPITGSDIGVAPRRDEGRLRRTAGV